MLLQVGHPSVAAGVASYSAFRDDPFGRLERTLSAMLAISFGSPERREEVLSGLRSVHREVKGNRSDGERYRALDPDLQMWVWATLVDTALRVERRYQHRLSTHEREQYYAESTELARAFRVPDSMIPESLRSFDDYIAETIASLVVTEDARAVCREIMRPAMWWAPRPVWVPIEWVTIDLLPVSLRRDYGFASLGRAERLALRQVRRVSRAVLPLLPEPLLINPFARQSIA